MALRNLTRPFFQIAKQTRLFSGVSRSLFHQKPLCPAVSGSSRWFSAVSNNDSAYQELKDFLQKEIQLEKSALKHPSKLPTVTGFEIKTEGPEVTLTRQSGNEKVTVTFNVTNTVNASEADVTASEQQQQNSGDAASQTPSQLKSRPSFTVDINRGGQTLSFLCSYLIDDYPNSQEQQAGEKELQSEDFQIDEFTVHDGEWNEKVYSGDCAVIDGELYDKLLNLLEVHGIGEDFANQLVTFSTAYEHRQYIGLLEKLQKFTK